MFASTATRRIDGTGVPERSAAEQPGTAVTFPADLSALRTRRKHRGRPGPMEKRGTRRTIVTRNRCFFRGARSDAPHAAPRRNYRGGNKTGIYIISGAASRGDSRAGFGQLESVFTGVCRSIASLLTGYEERLKSGAAFCFRRACVPRARARSIDILLANSTSGGADATKPRRLFNAARTSNLHRHGYTLWGKKII